MNELPVRIDDVKDGIELWLRLLHHRQVVSKGSEAGFKGVVVQTSGLVLVEMTEHHGELLEGVLRHSALVPGLYLLLQVVPDPHAQLIELIILLGQANSGVLRVPKEYGHSRTGMKGTTTIIPVIQDKLLLENSTEVLNLSQVTGTAGNFMSLKSSKFSSTLEMWC